MWWMTDDSSAVIVPQRDWREPVEHLFFYIPRRLQWTYLISSSSSFSVASDECCPLYICFPSMTNQPDGILLFASLWKIKRPRDALTSSESGHLLFPHKHLLLLLAAFASGSRWPWWPAGSVQPSVIAPSAAAAAAGRFRPHRERNRKQNKTKKKDEKEADLLSDSRDGRAGPDNK